MDNIRYSDRLIWILIVVAVCAVLASQFLGFRISWASFLKAALIELVLLLGSWFYRTVRKDAPVSDALMSTAQIIAFATAAAPLSYIAASASLPQWDNTLVQLDRRFGFDWMALLKTINAAPWLHDVLAAAYQTFAFQVTAIVLVLAAARRPLQIRIFVLGFMFTTLATIAISALIPAEGVWSYWHLSESDAPGIVPITRDLPYSTFSGLRVGTIRLLVADGAVGIISFPSLHAALGLLFILALWPVPYIRWMSIALNAAMIAATPIDGSHYFCDVAAGLSIAAVVWVVLKRAFDQTEPVKRYVVVEVSTG